jgi:hypothetical protein
MIYLLTAIGLTPSGNSTVHIYTQTAVQYTFTHREQYSTHLHTDSSTVHIYTHLRTEQHMETEYSQYYIRNNKNMWVELLSQYSNWLWAGQSGDRVLVGARFSAPVQTGPGAYTASCTTGAGSFLGVESGRGITLTPSSSEV